MNSVTLELTHDNEKARKSLRGWLLEKVQTWFNGLMQGEMTSIWAGRLMHR